MVSLLLRSAQLLAHRTLTLIICTINILFPCLIASLSRVRRHSRTVRYTGSVPELPGALQVRALVLRAEVAARASARTLPFHEYDEFSPLLPSPLLFVLVCHCYCYC